jgi:hypothetical protein
METLPLMCKRECANCICKVQRAKIEKAAELGFLTDEQRERELAQIGRPDVTSREVHRGRD